MSEREVGRLATEKGVLVEALAKALCDADPALGLRFPTCALCGDVLVWHEGNGGQWIGAIPPRDWMNCHGSVNGPRHEVSLRPVQPTSPRPDDSVGGV